VSQSTTPSWDHVIVERSNDNGATWAGVRNGHAAIAAGATLTIWDYESGNGEPVVYRAQAELTSVVGGITQVSVSQWSTPTAAVSWSSAFSWLKSPLFPTLNLQVRPTGVTTLRRPARRGVFAIAGRTNPIVVSDVRGGRTGTLSFTTLTATEADAVEALLMLGGALLYQPAPAWQSPTFYLSPGDLDEVPPADDLAYAGRYWSFDATEVDAPVGDALFVSTITTAPVVIPGGVATWNDVVLGNADWLTVVARYPTWADLSNQLTLTSSWVEVAAHYSSWSSAVSTYATWTALLAGSSAPGVVHLLDEAGNILTDEFGNELTTN
jgi:hypothetical protein